MDRTPRNRMMGRRQRHVIRALADHGVWYPGCGWGHGTNRQTEAVLSTLVHRGEVTNDYTGLSSADPVRYWLTPAGWAWLIHDAATDAGLCSYGSKGFDVAVHRIGRLSSLALLSQDGPVDWRGNRV